MCIGSKYNFKFPRDQIILQLDQFISKPLTGINWLRPKLKLYIYQNKLWEDEVPIWEHDKPADNRTQIIGNIQVYQESAP